MDYYESLKRELKTKPIDERPKTKVEESTRLGAKNPKLVSMSVLLCVYDNFTLLSYTH